MHHPRERQPISPPLAIRPKPASELPGDDAIFNRLKERVTPVSSPAGARVALTSGSTELVCVINSGMLMLAVGPGKTSRTVTALLYAGDIISKSHIVSQPGVGLSTMLPSQYLSLEAWEFDRFISHNPDLVQNYSRSTAKRLASHSLHASCLSLLTCEQKVATLLLELALNIGNTSAGALGVDIPMSRSDIADYLALNVDTVSRTMTQIKTENIIASIGRRRIIVKNPKGLLNSTPLADATLKLNEHSPLASYFKLAA